MEAGFKPLISHALLGPPAPPAMSALTSPSSNLSVLIFQEVPPLRHYAVHPSPVTVSFSLIVLSQTVSDELSLLLPEGSIGLLIRPAFPNNSLAYNGHT